MKRRTGRSGKEESYQKRYDEDFKRNAVELLEQSGKPLKHVARELGISFGSLREWRESQKRGQLAWKPLKPERWSRMKLEAENERLRRENDQIKKQRDILKKALSILSDPPPGSML